MDFRSDTVTKPNHEMLQVMLAAEVGDDVYSDDPTVNQLETWAAERHGFEAAIFVSSGTQANLIALMAHCERGDEYLCGQQAHNYKYEAGGAAVLGSIHPQPIENEPDGTICLSKLKAAIKPNDFHFARTKLVSLENTINGKILPLEYLARARQFCSEHELQLHLDGARVYNAAVALKINIVEIAKYFDSMTICLSKGLGAPIGSLLLGNAELISKARRLRKMLGGAMRQVGFIAAAGRYALEQGPKQLASDHQNAKLLAHKLSQLDGFQVNPHHVATNIVFAKIDIDYPLDSLVSYLTDQGFKLSAARPMRFVTHNGINEQDIHKLIDAIDRFNQSNR